MIRALLLAAVLPLACACGQKGPLKLPEPAKPASADPAAPAAPTK